MYITICSWCGKEYEVQRLRVRGFCSDNCRRRSNRLDRRGRRLANELREIYDRLNRHHEPGRRPAQYVYGRR